MLSIALSRRLASLAAAAVLMFASPPLFAAFIVPSVGDARFGWDFGDPGSVGAGWDIFSVPFGPPGNLPDVAASNFGSAGNSVVTQIGTPTAFIIGPGTSGNIYSFAEATGFTTTIDASDLSGPATTVVAQFRTLGTELDYASILLSGGSLTDVAPTLTEELSRVPAGGFGGDVVESLVKWDLGASESSYTLTFGAAGSSMSLAQFQVDANAIPEPAGASLLAGLTMVAVATRRRVRRG